MEKNEALQWTIVALVILFALLWAGISIIKITRKKGIGGGCNCCSQVNSCTVKDIKNEIVRKQKGNCHDGQSARS